MSKIYSKVANEMFSKLWFSGFKQFVKELWRSKVKESMHFVEKNTNFNKNETESKMENPIYSFREMNLVLRFI